MKILFVSHCGTFYGACQSTLSLMIGLREKNIESILLIPYDGKFREEAVKHGFKVYIKPYPRCCIPASECTDSFRIKNITEKFESVFRLNELIESEKPTLIYTISSVIDVGLLLAKFSGLRHVWHIREYGDLDFNLQPDLGKDVLKKMISSSNNIIYVSKSLADYFSVDTVNRQSVVYNGVYSKKEIDANLEETEINYSFGFVGFVSEKKGFYRILEALHLVKQHATILLKLIVYGNVEYNEKIKVDEYLDRLGLHEQVIFKGYMDDKNKIFSSFGFLIMASESEAFGRVTAEAMLKGVVVIGHNSGGTAELIKNGQTGILYDGTATDLAKKMIEVQGSIAECRQIRKQAFEYAYKNFLTEDYVDNVYRILTGEEQKNF